MTDGSLAIAAGDVDDDGDEDIVTASESKLVILHDPMRHPNGKVDEYPIGATEIALADFDDDGKLDLVAVGSVVRVMLHAL
jgi:hypothetical protein